MRVQWVLVTGCPLKLSCWDLGVALVMKIRRVLSGKQSKSDLGGVDSEKKAWSD